MWKSIVCAVYFGFFTNCLPFLPSRFFFWADDLRSALVSPCAFFLGRHLDGFFLFFIVPHLPLMLPCVSILTQSSFLNQSRRDSLMRSSISLVFFFFLAPATAFLRPRTIFHLTRLGPGTGWTQARSGLGPGAVWARSGLGPVQVGASPEPTFTFKN